MSSVKARVRAKDMRLTQAARLYFTSAANAPIDSLFSQYHKDLWGSYRLLGLEHYASRQIQDEAGSFLAP